VFHALPKYTLWARTCNCQVLYLASSRSLTWNYANSADSRSGEAIPRACILKILHFWSSVSVFAPVGLSSKPLSPELRVKGLYSQGMHPVSGSTDFGFTPLLSPLLNLTAWPSGIPQIPACPLPKALRQRLCLPCLAHKAYKKHDLALAGL
jgi:hypothetical protein